jgi:Raf kinase inhibitor-like YbhB/YbcL family protein
MISVRALFPSCAVALATTSAFADPAALTVTLNGLTQQGNILPRHAFCQPDPVSRTRDGGNVSPELKWEKGPEGTQSYAVIMHDPDVPTVFDNANREGKILPADMPRQEFIHWVLTDIPATVIRLPEGADADRVEKTGKGTQRTRYGVRGINDYGKHIKGTFYGYDGPCPPWNDERLHHYTYVVYALDVPSLKLFGKFTAADARKAMEGHVLAQGKATGLYTQNPQMGEGKAERAHED